MHEWQQVYARMMALRYVPTSTTYTALISAYGKAGQLDAALDTFDQMVSTSPPRLSSFIHVLGSNAATACRAAHLLWMKHAVCRHGFISLAEA